MYSLLLIYLFIIIIIVIIIIIIIIVLLFKDWPCHYLRSCSDMDLVVLRAKLNKHNNTNTQTQCHRNKP